ncbi:MAG: exosortase system-associated protein, TIGR04073 family [Chthoniobacterales bacterium]|nr:exosortase system-associated protein, TIGR04073 family [Chthoniobacterales bacterium]
MRILLALTLAFGLSSFSRADIHDPPSNDYGPTRKLGRGVSNLLFGVAELPTTVAKINQDEGNSAAAGYGVVRGVGRSVLRIQAGVFEILTFPFPVVRWTYYPVLESDTHWIHSGYKEFPPELGNESKYPYVRHY